MLRLLKTLTAAAVWGSIVYAIGIAVDVWIIQYDTVIAEGVAVGVACIIAYRSIMNSAATRKQSKGI